MSYKTKPQLKLYKYNGTSFILQAIIDDYMEFSFEDNLYSAGAFTISINYNIPNALLFQRGLFVAFGDGKRFGEIINITDAIGSNGKGSQTRTITGYDARYIFKRRIIKNLNNVENWAMTDKGELCMRNLIADQCGSNAEVKRQLPVINDIPAAADAIGKEYSVSESFSNLYEVLCTIATQSEIGWRLDFDGEKLKLVCFNGVDRHNSVRFDTNYESLSQGQFTDSADSYANSVYVGGKGQGDDRDIYEGEALTDGNAPEGLDRFEAWDNQSSMTTSAEYEAEALSILTQYGQTLQVSGKGLAKSPYIYGEEYEVGDIITIAFSGKSAVVQILSVTEHWAFNSYDINFSFGKPQPDLNNQLQLILKQIQKASNKTNSTDSVRWYTIPTDTEMPSSDVTYRTIGFIGDCGAGATFKLYLDNEKTGAKTYHIYFKQLAGAGKLTLTTRKEGASNLILNAGTYVAIIYVDENGNITSQGMTATNTVEAGNNQPVTSDGVNSAISGAVSGLVTGVKGNNEVDYRTGNVNITKANIGLGNVDNTSDANKPVSTAQATAINNAINALDVASVGGSGKYLSAISETDGKISATAGNISGTITAGDNAPVSGGAVADILSSLPTDAVLHYSFDELPDYPDGTAVYKKDNDFTDTTGWSGNATATVSSGKITLRGSADTRKAYDIQMSAGLIICIKGIANKSANLYFTVRHPGATSDTTLKNFNVESGKYFEVCVIVDAQSSYFNFYCVAEWDITISQIYIGDGSYNTPIIDNANGQNNATNYGGIAVQGVSGKGAYFLNGKYAEVNDFNFTDNFSISVWVKPATMENGKWRELLSKSSCFYIRNGDGGSNNFLFGAVYNKSASRYEYFTIKSSLLDDTKYTHICIIKNGTTLTTFVDKDSKRISNLNFTEMNRNNNSLIINGTSNTDSQSYDDLLVFNRALTEKEVVALYYNKANTPKYYSFADYRLDNM